MTSRNPLTKSAMPGPYGPQASRKSSGSKGRASINTPGFSWPGSLLPLFFPPLCLRLGVFGLPGTGKTSLLVPLVKTSPLPTMYLEPDPVGGPGTLGARCRTRGEILDAMAQHGGVARIDEPALFPWALSAAWHIGGCLLVIDEAQEVFGKDCPANRRRILLQGRRRGVALVMATQWPSLLHDAAQRVCTLAAIGTLTGRADVETCQRIYNVDPRMPLHEFRVVGPGVDGRIRSMPFRG